MFDGMYRLLIDRLWQQSIRRRVVGAANILGGLGAGVEAVAAKPAVSAVQDCL